MPKRNLLITVFLLTFLMFSTAAIAATSRDMDRVTGFGSVIGRAMACDLEWEPQTFLVMAWMDSRFRERAPDIAEQFVQVVAQNRNGQLTGEFPEDCNEVAAIFAEIVWPNFGR
jgi:hypothetical protein